MTQEEHINSLTDSARDALDLTDEERIEKIYKQSFVAYSAANDILNELERLINFPKCDRMPNLLIVGGTNNGKSTILNRFIEMHPSGTTPIGTIVPVVKIQAPINATHVALYEKILEHFQIPYSGNASAAKKEMQAVESLRNAGTKMLIIDEFQDIFHSVGSQQKKFLTGVKHLGNDIKIPIVAAGVETVQSVVAQDPQLANRFDVIKLGKWNFNKEFGRLLMSFMRTMPLKKTSSVSKKVESTYLFQQSEGILGEVITLLQRAAEEAIKSGKEMIDIEILEKTRFVKPADRSK